MIMEMSISPKSFYNVNKPQMKYKWNPFIIREAGFKVDTEKHDHGEKIQKRKGRGTICLLGLLGF